MNTETLQKLVIGFAVMIVIFSVAILFILRTPTDGPEATLPQPILESELALEFYGKEDPLAQTLVNSRARGATKSEVIASFPQDYGLKVFNDDITADTIAEHIVIRTDSNLPEIDSRLKERGFSGQVSGLIIYRDTTQSIKPVFIMTTEAMHNEYGMALVSQVRAEYGYAIKLNEFFDENYYSASVQLLSVVLVDQEGRAASDELTIYWDPGPEVFKATNTFGAPGTFE